MNFYIFLIFVNVKTAKKLLRVHYRKSPRAPTAARFSPKTVFHQKDHWVFDIGHGVIDIGHGVIDIGHGVIDIGHGVSDIGHGVIDIGR